MTRSISYFRNSSTFVNLNFYDCIMLLIKCPTCGKEIEYEGNEFRPFCSERCKLLDFGAWADEEYSLPTETASMTEEEFEELEQALSKRKDQ